RSPWDYADSDELRDSFFRWLGQLDVAGVPVENHPRIMVWLTDKRYLKDFEAVGVPVVPTQVVNDLGQIALPARFSAWGSLIVKPCVSAAGTGLVLLESDSAAHAYQDEFDALCRANNYFVQRFLPEIRTSGEWSLVYFGGYYSHAAHKLPADGKILVHAEQ